MKDYKYTYIDKKYPFSQLNLKKIGLFSVIIFIVLLFFKPFGFINYEGNKLLAASGFSFVCLVNLLVSNYFIKPQLSKLYSAKWSVLKEIIYTLITILIISVSNFYYYIRIIDKIDLNIYIFLYFLLITILIGAFPISMFVLIKHNYILKNKLYQIVGDENQIEGKEDIVLFFSSLNKSDEAFSVPIKDFLFLEVIKNNIYIYYIDGETVNTRIIRNTLVSVMEDLSNYDKIFRCHRSYVINLNNVTSSSGNSNGYRVKFKKYDHQISISRQYAPDFRKLMY